MTLPPMASLEEDLRQNPRSRRFSDLAQEYEKMGRVAEARALYERGLEIYPNHWQARILLAHLYLGEGKLAQAREMVERVLLAVHDSVPANHLAADVYWDLGLKDRARKHYQIVDLLEPGRPGVQERLNELGGQPEGLGEQAPARPPMARSLDQTILTSAVSRGEERQSEPAVDVASARAVSAGAPSEEEPLSFRAPPEVFDVPLDGPEPIKPEQGTGETVCGSPFGPDSLWGEPSSSAAVENPFREKEPAPPDEVEPVPEGIATSAEEVAGEGETAQDTDTSHSGVLGLNTYTLAELYERQGYPEKAVEIYQRMLLQDSENSEVTGRIRTLMRRIAGEAPEMPAVHQEDVEKALRQRRITALDGWLQRVREGHRV